MKSNAKLQPITISDPEIFRRLVELRQVIATKCDKLRYRQRLTQGYSARRQVIIDTLQEQHKQLTEMMVAYTQS